MANAPAPSSAPVSTAPSAPATPSGGSNPGVAEATPPTSTPKSEVNSTPKTYEIKVDGRTVRMTEEELIQHASLGKQAYSKFEESAKIRKEAEGFKAKMKEDFISALMDPALGLTKEQIKERFETWYHEEVIQPSKLSPEQLKLKEAEKELKAYKDEKAKFEKSQREEQQAKETDAARTDLQQKLIKAIDDSQLPKTKFTVSRAAYWMRRNLENGFDAPMEVIMSQVKNERNEVMRDLVQSVDGERLIELLGGDEVVNKIRRFDIARLRGGNKPAADAAAPKPTSIPVNTQKRGFTTQADVDAKLREIRRTGKF